MSKKIIAVTGSTGAQGGGVVRAILDDPASEFAVRAITRKPDSDKAKALAKRGVEVVAADLDDVDSLRRAFAGAHGAFLVTNFWEHFSADKEIAQARSLATASKDAGLRHAIWSTLEDTRKKVPLSDSRMPTLHGKWKVPHFDGKGEADQLFRDAGVPTTFLLTSFYWENLIYFGMNPKKGPDGKLALTLPMGDAKLPGIAAEDIGRSAYGIFKRGPEFVGKTVGIAGDHPTGAQMAASLGKALGREVVYNAVSFDAFRAFGFPGADDLGNMFQYKHDFNREFCGARDLAFSRSLNPKLQSFDQWAQANKDRIPLG
jgi:uncharacterized protein YbjT (DUF2867 family)